jgi:hypothetical protein
MTVDIQLHPATAETMAVGFPPERKRNLERVGLYSDRRRSKKCSVRGRNEATSNRQFERQGLMVDPVKALQTERLSKAQTLC